MHLPDLTVNGMAMVGTALPLLLVMNVETVTWLACLEESVELPG